MAEIISFGEWLQKRRTDLKLSRTVLAERVGCSPETIKKIERDERRPSVQIAELLAEHLYVPEVDQAAFIRRARGEFVPEMRSPLEMGRGSEDAESQPSSPKHNVPTQTTPFFGRAREILEIQDQFSDPNCRLVTILGAGGMGKTRLAQAVAVEIATSFRHGVHYVGLAPVSAASGAEGIDPVVGTRADTLKLSLKQQERSADEVIAYLSEREMLLVFDNFEHLLESADFMADLLVRTAAVKILITSRERLNLAEEWLYPLQGLHVPEKYDASDAVALFEQRARQVRPDFAFQDEREAVFQICERVEGMPLAIELAAAWVRQLPSLEILHGIEAELDFLETRLRNIPRRHRSIRAVMGQAWEKLTTREQQVLRKLSIFKGGFELESAQAVADGSLTVLGSLVDQSLLSMTGPGRYGMHELLRQFAAEKLAELPEEAAAVEAKHAQYFMTLMAGMEAHFKGPEIVSALSRIRTDIENMRAAIRWSIEHALHYFDKPTGVVLFLFFDLQGWFLEGEAITRQILAKLREMPQRAPLTPEGTYDPAWLIAQQYEAQLGNLLLRLGRYAEAVTILKDVTSKFERQTAPTPWLEGWSYAWLSVAHSYPGDYTLGFEASQKGVELGELVADRYWLAVALFVHSQNVKIKGGYEAAERLVQRSGALFEAMGEIRWSGYVWQERSMLAIIRGDLAAAESHQQQSLAVRQAVGDFSGVSFSLNHLGNVSRLQGKYDAALHHYHEGHQLAEEINMPYSVANIQEGLGALYLEMGEIDQAKKAFEKAVEIRPQSTLGAYGLGRVALLQGDLDLATRYFLKGLTTASAHRAVIHMLRGVLGMAEVAQAQGDLDRALSYMALVKDHPKNEYETRLEANRLWEEATEGLFGEQVAAVQTQDLDQIVADLLNGIDK